jgi:alkanesulfonate monooxygenase SsuD/methylene tetrahydromethanopterin reductase-like flavin-dependent oxidoreductase (luciferase family)
MNDDLTPEQIAKLCQGSDRAAILEALDRLKQDKRKIEAQLMAAKSGMLDVRSTLLAQGWDPRQAQIEATASNSQNWLSAAKRALLKKDRQLMTLKTRLRELSGGRDSTAGKVMPERKAVVLRGTPEELADQVQVWLDDGWSSLTAITLDANTAIVVFRQDFL